MLCFRIWLMIMLNNFSILESFWLILIGYYSSSHTIHDVCYTWGWKTLFMTKRMVLISIIILPFEWRNCHHIVLIVLIFIIFLYFKRKISHQIVQIYLSINLRIFYQIVLIALIFVTFFTFVFFCHHFIFRIENFPWNPFNLYHFYHHSKLRMRNL